MKVFVDTLSDEDKKKIEEYKKILKKEEERNQIDHITKWIKGSSSTS
jgi:hypothetical protein